MNGIEKKNGWDKMDVMEDGMYTSFQIQQNKAIVIYY